MSQGISIQKLIDQVRRELLEPTKVSEYPVFFVENVELELVVSITKGAEGEVSISVLDTLSGKFGGKESKEAAHTIKVSLTPMVTLDEIKDEIDPKTYQKIKKATTIALVKGDNGEQDLDDLSNM